MVQRKQGLEYHPPLYNIRLDLRKGNGGPAIQFQGPLKELQPFLCRKLFVKKDLNISILHKFLWQLDQPLLKMSTKHQITLFFPLNIRHILKFIYNNRLYLEICMMAQTIGFVISEVLQSLFFSPCEHFDKNLKKSQGMLPSGFKTMHVLQLQLHVQCNQCQNSSNLVENYFSITACPVNLDRTSGQ